MKDVDLMLSIDASLETRVTPADIRADLSKGLVWMDQMTALLEAVLFSCGQVDDPVMDAVEVDATVAILRLEQAKAAIESSVDSLPVMAPRPR